ncbi:alpha/beta hydrolase [Streptomyces kaniharaensis]|uniref:Alpha/beta hydrolase n=1 Tax=Streptomyces kaniharaensis TaxID=212423 RepID=A0A6N7KTR1_9ACTN|nr:alpha/beta hydrolase [Streptomyces kaniharaensis]MQS13404.1 alpha/beta hydrolase [Streptomyces kaniharaensis]
MNTVVSADGTEIAYSVTGSGPAVVFVDGALCHRAFGPGTAVAQQLAAHHTVYTYDRRGRGESGDTSPFAVEREIEDLAAVIEAAGGSARVVGVSSGAALALRAAASGVGISRIAVYEPPFSTEDGQRARFTAYLTDLEAALAEERRGDAAARFMTIVGMPAEMVDQMRGAPMWPAFEAVAPTLAYDAACLGAGTGGSVPVEILAEVAVPALVLDGGASPELLRAPAREVAAAVPGAEHRTLADQTHEVAAEVLAPVLVEFFA